MRHYILFCLAALWPLNFAISEPLPFRKGFVTISDGGTPERQLYVESRVARNNSPTLVFVNGLTYSTTQWTQLVEALNARDPDLGIVLYDMVGMGKTLLANAPVTYDIPFPNQTRDLHDLIHSLAIPGRKILVGLSYGGAVTLKSLADHPDDFNEAVAIAPFLQRLPDQDNWVKMMVRWHRLTFPLDRRAEDEIYALYLHQLVFNTYPLAEPVVLENPYKLEGVYRMVKGALDWTATSVVNHLPPHKLHLIGPANDEYIPAADQLHFWNQVPASAQASFLKLAQSRHKAPEDQPDFIAGWLIAIAKGLAPATRGLIFDGDPGTNVAKSGAFEIDLGPKPADCEVELTSH